MINGITRTRVQLVWIKRKTVIRSAVSMVLSKSMFLSIWRSGRKVILGCGLVQSNDVIF